MTDWFASCFKCTFSTLFVFALLLIGSTNLFADDASAIPNVTDASSATATSSSEQLVAIYQYSGINAHLSWVLSTVQQEAATAHANCSNQAALPDLAKPLIELLSIEALQASFLAELDERLSQLHRDEIMAWVTSNAGQQIHKVEADSIDFDETQFEQMLSDFRDSDKNTEERHALMRDMLTDTGAVYFISAMNTETSAIVATASVCSLSAEDMETAAAAVKDERGSEALYRPFMRQELIIPSSVVYQTISDEALDAYSDFAKSDAGNAYFSALIKGVRSVLSGKVDALVLAIEAI